MAKKKGNDMGRNEAKTWLKLLGDIVGDVKIEVSCLLPMISDFRKSILTNLRDEVQTGVKAERLLERLK